LLDAHSTLTTNDAELLPRCRQGDEAAWHDLAARHTRKVFGLAYRFTGRVDEAEDLTQEVFVKVYQTLFRYREADGPFGGWLMAVARNHAIDHYRRRKQERMRRSDDAAVLETMPAHGEHPIAGLERESARACAQGAAALPRTCGCPHPVRPQDCRTRRSRPSCRSSDGEEPNQPGPRRAGEAPARATGRLAVGGDRRG
jgi:RNA polymerase sigma factor (sigma-70 family)